MESEKRIQSRIIAILKEYEKNGAPVFWEKRQAGGFTYRKGLADLYIVFAGRHYEFEIKSPTGAPSAMQEKFRFECRQKQIPYYIVSNVDDFCSKLKEIAKI